MNVLDASAVVAFFKKPRPEPDAPLVRAALDEGAAMTTLNYSEALVELARLWNLETDDMDDEIRAEIDFEADLRMVPLDLELARDAARIERFTRVRELGTISLADRTCMALGRSLKAKVFTTDRAWVVANNKHRELGLKIVKLRTEKDLSPG